MKHLNRASAGALVVCTALSLAACSSGQSDGSSTVGGGGGGTTVAASKPITIAYLQKQGDQQYFIDEAKGAKAQAAKLGNVKVTVVNLGTDSNKAMSSLQTEIGLKVNGIAIVVPDQKTGPQVITAAKGAGIPLVASDDPIKSGDGKTSPFVGFDSVQMGKSVGKEAGRLFKQAGWTAANTRIMTGYQQGLSDCQQREQGEEAGFKDAAGTSVSIVKLGTDNSVVDAQNKAGAALTAHPGVKHWVAWGCNDENETGIVTALQNQHIAPSNIIGVGLGGYLTCKDWKAGVKSGNKAALYLSGANVGATAIKTLVAKIRTGTPLPPKTIAPTTVANATNWKSVMKGECS